jgi:hypothetical protein
MAEKIASDSNDPLDLGIGSILPADVHGEVLKSSDDAELWLDWFRLPTDAQYLPVSVTGDVTDYTFPESVLEKFDFSLLPNDFVARKLEPAADSSTEDHGNPVEERE